MFRASNLDRLLKMGLARASKRILSCRALNV